MEPAGRIEPQSWMRAAETRRVIEALEAGGSEARFVGGCVRDSLIGRPVKDVDIATPDEPERVMELLRRAGLKAVPTGVEHGTITAVSDHHPFEITTLRRDVETFGRHARVAFTDDWIADAARRDFTMNAMFCAPDGTIYDAFGGWEDLLIGRVRFVGEPEQRIREDYLRVLRFFRFHAHYGQGPPEPVALRAAVKHAGGLAHLSGERLRQELLRLLTAPDPRQVIAVMAEGGVLAAVLPEARGLARLSGLIEVEQKLAVSPDEGLRLAALLEASPEEIEAEAERLRLSRKERERLLHAAPPERVQAVEPELSAQWLRRFLHRHGGARARDLLLLAAATRSGHGAAVKIDRLSQALEQAARWSPKRLPVNGGDLRALGVKAGPEMGRLLRALDDWWQERDFRPDREACLDKLREMVAGEP